MNTVNCTSQITPHLKQLQQLAGKITATNSKQWVQWIAYDQTTLSLNSSSSNDVAVALPTSLRSSGRLLCLCVCDCRCRLRLLLLRASGGGFIHLQWLDRTIHSIFTSLASY